MVVSERSGVGLLRITNWVGGIALAAGIGGLATTNPDQAAYETYATAQLSDYLSTTICEGNISPALSQLLQEQCDTLLTDNQDQIRQLISSRTVRANYAVFSLYYTQFAIPGVAILPAYEFQTLGIANQFFTYKAGRM
jgi:hypothetical protein